MWNLLVLKTKISHCQQDENFEMPAEGEQNFQGKKILESNKQIFST